MGTEGGWAGTALCYNLNLLLSARPKNQHSQLHAWFSREAPLGFCCCSERTKQLNLAPGGFTKLWQQEQLCPKCTPRLHRHRWLMFSSVKVPLCYPSGTEDVQEGVNAACSSVLPSGYQQPVSAAPGDVMPGWLCRLHSPSLHSPSLPRWRCVRDHRMRQGPQRVSGTPACLRDPAVLCQAGTSPGQRGTATPTIPLAAAVVFPS